MITKLYPAAVIRQIRTVRARLDTPQERKRLARQSGEKTYRGEDCARGHGGLRYTNCNGCLQCLVDGRESRRGVRALLSGAKSRAETRGLEFNLNYEELEIPECCPVFGVKFDPCGSGSEFVPSLDRVNNAKGYVDGNVVVISLRANRLKNNGTAEEHEKIAAYMRSHGVE